jgi:hypothetical protein
MIEIKTLKHNMEGDVSREDVELTTALNEGWEILNIAILDRNNEYSMLRIVTLQRVIPGPSADRPTPVPTLPSDVIEAYREWDRANEDTSVSQSQWYAMRVELLELIGTYIPNEAKS